MRQCVIGIWKDATNGFIEGVPMIYANGTWTRSLKPYIYDGTTWQPVGHAGTLMIPFITSTGDPFYESGGTPLYVRSHE